MTRFASRNASTADVPASRDQLWAVLSSPEKLAALTPLVKAISAIGDDWCWQLTSVSALGVSVQPSFVERMTFDPGREIRFSPTPGSTDRAGAEGTYELADGPDGTTRLAIDLTLFVDLPLPRMARGAVEKVMAATMQRTGERFAQNLYRELGIAGASVTIRAAT